ncbi:MAG: Hsp20/alpha crystallin family protein [Deltaproteobacteria bacterium]|nr:Hsp20/alpha crystallin family protein [Deltaproteobacteria bacterium]
MWTRVNDINQMFGAMDLLRSRMGDLFGAYERPYGGDFGWPLTEGTPRTNLNDNGDKLEMNAEVPGLTKEDLNIKVQGNYLEISGARKSAAPEGYKAHRVESETTSFTRSFTLPCDIDTEKVEASLQNGILTLVLPKAEVAKPKQVTIK